MNKLILLLKRPLTEDDEDTLEKYLSVTYFNERVNLERDLPDLISSCDLLVLPLYNDSVKYWYESQRMSVDHDTTCVILLEKQGVKINKDRLYGERIARKFLPKQALNKAQMMLMLSTAHLPSIRPWYKRLLACIIHNL